MEADDLMNLTRLATRLYIAMVVVGVVGFLAHCTHQQACYESCAGSVECVEACK